MGLDQQTANEQEAGAMPPGAGKGQREGCVSGEERGLWSQSQDLDRKAPEEASKARPEPRNGARPCLRRRPERKHTPVYRTSPPGQAPLISKQPWSFSRAAGPPTAVQFAVI